MVMVELEALTRPLPVAARGGGDLWQQCASPQTMHLGNHDIAMQLNLAGPSPARYLAARALVAGGGARAARLDAGGASSWTAAPLKTDAEAGAGDGDRECLREGRVAAGAGACSSATAASSRPLGALVATTVPDCGGGVACLAREARGDGDLVLKPGISAGGFCVGASWLPIEPAATLYCSMGTSLRGTAACTALLECAWRSRPLAC
jgi:hypothetical protein